MPVLIFCGAIVLFIICRELICWYYKTNRIVKMLEDQNIMLKELLQHFGLSTTLANETSKESVGFVEVSDDDEKDKDKIVI
jgi:hypothetical protein